MPSLTHALKPIMWFLCPSSLLWSFKWQVCSTILYKEPLVIWITKNTHTHTHTCMIYVFLCFPIYLPWSDATVYHDLSFWMLSFKPVFFHYPLSLHQETLIPLWFFAIRVVSYAYLKLLIFFPAILTQACASSSLAFHMKYSAYKLNKQGDNIQPWCTPFPIWNQSIIPCLVQVVASWLHIGFSGGRSCGLAFISLEEFSTVCCDWHSQRL